MTLWLSGWSSPSPSNVTCHSWKSWRNRNLPGQIIPSLILFNLSCIHYPTLPYSTCPTGNTQIRKNKMSTNLWFWKPGGKFCSLRNPAPGFESSLKCDCLGRRCTWDLLSRVLLSDLLSQHSHVPLEMPREIWMLNGLRMSSKEVWHDWRVISLSHSDSCSASLLFANIIASKSHWPWDCISPGSHVAQLVRAAFAAGTTYGTLCSSDS